MESSQTVIQCFDKEITTFFQRLSETIVNRYSVKIELGNKPYEMQCLEKYKEAYEQTEKETHCRCFSDFFETNRTELLNCLKSDKFFDEKHLYIQYAKGTSLESRTQNIRLCIGDIYGMIRNTGKPGGSSNKKHIFLLHLLRCCYYGQCVKNKNPIELEKVVEQIETMLQCKNKLQKFTKAPAQTTTPMLSGVANMMKTMMPAMGMDPKLMESVNTDQMATAMQNVFSNPKVNSLFSELFSTVASSMNPQGEKVDISFDKIIDTLNTAAKDGDTELPAFVKDVAGFSSNMLKNIQKENPTYMTPEETMKLPLFKMPPPPADDVPIEGESTSTQPQPLPLENGEQDIQLPPLPLLSECPDMTQIQPLSIDPPVIQENSGSSSIESEPTMEGDNKIDC